MNEMDFDVWSNNGLLVGPTVSSWRFVYFVFKSVCVGDNIDIFLTVFPVGGCSPVTR